MKDTNNNLIEIFNQVDRNEKNMIELQKKLTSKKAIAPDSGGDGEIEKALELVQFLKKKGLKYIDTYYAPDNRVSSRKRPNIVVTIPGRKERPRFWIMSHLDVVPPGEESLWHSDPFEAVVKDNKIYGRGVEDNQQGIVASIFAALSILESGLKPYYTVKLLFVADEEIGSKYGIKYILDNCPIFHKDDFFLVPDIGNKDGTMLEIAEKHMVWIKFITTGKQCHASMPELGQNAFIAASDLVIQLNELHQIFNQEDELFSPSKSTFSPTKKEANVPNINTIPGEDVFYIDCRILPSIRLEEVLDIIDKKVKEIEKKYSVKISYSIILDESSRPTLKSAPVVQSMKRAIKKVYQVEGKEMGVGGGTVAAFLRNAGYDTVAWSRSDVTAHMPNEYCRIENMIGDAKVMACVIMGM